MGNGDYYGILGVSSNATEDEIRKAFRRLAMQYHPDVCTAEAPSDDHFKNISEAYDTLGHSGRRREYDRRQQAGSHRRPHTYADRQGFHSGSRASPGFGSHRGARTHIYEDPPGAGSRSRHRGSDLHYDLILDLEQVWSGVTVDVAVLHRRFEVSIPPGVDTGSVIRVQGQGGPGFRGGPAGDLFITIRVKEHPYFHREGLDIFAAVPISFSEARHGANLEIPGPVGKLVLRVPPGARSGTQFRYRGLGLPDPEGHRRGDFFAVVQVLPNGSEL